MKTVWKMLGIMAVGSGLIAWYLSYHPHPLSNADGIFLVAGSSILVWVAFLIWKIDCLQEDAKLFKTQATEAGDFIQIFVDQKRVEETLSTMAVRLEESFKPVWELQGSHPGDTSEIRAVLKSVDQRKERFWKAVHLGHQFFGVEPRKSYKGYIRAKSA